MNKKCCHGISAEAIAGALLRLSIGMLFFVAGLNKVMGPKGAAAVSQGIIEQFSDTYLPWILVAPYAYALPYLEVAVGALLLLGLFTQSALTAAGLLLLSLAFGMAVKQEFAVVAQNLNYLLITAIALWFASRDNRCGLDRFFRRADSCSSAPPLGFSLLDRIRAVVSRS
ncbi:MAG TPA: DoxX family membrane protein [Candidatus Hydrogenedentes bacterium]|nr:DoxX family membrane protein [Candidatus Hydrogenedentota bacterium]HOS02044.1 DoxX family membrane protein [Candidatus Hydrogenedentota bacterium]